MTKEYARYAKNSSTGTVHRIRPHNSVLQIGSSDIVAYCGYKLEEDDEMKVEGEVDCGGCKRNMNV